MNFRKAVKTQSKLRMALVGPPGSGKTWTALALATSLAPGKVALVDTERGSASKYSDVFDFDVLELDDFHPEKYVEAIRAAGRAGFAALVVDSLSHAWVGKGGALEIHDNATARTKNSFMAWREVTPLHNALVDSMLQSPCHVIATVRAKTEYVQEKDSNNRTTVRKVGMAPVQRDGLEYEFDVVGDMDADNRLIVSKTRCPALAGKVYHRPGKDLAEVLSGWLGGVARPAAAPPSQALPAPTGGREPGDDGAGTVTDAQRDELLLLIDETDTDPAAFCRAYRIPNLEHLPAASFADACGKLHKKLERPKAATP